MMARERRNVAGIGLLDVVSEPPAVVAIIGMFALIFTVLITDTPDAGFKDSQMCSMRRPKHLK
jgi:hypothetical protein